MNNDENRSTQNSVLKKGEEFWLPATLIMPLSTSLNFCSLCSYSHMVLCFMLLEYGLQMAKMSLWYSAIIILSVYWIENIIMAHFS